MKKGCYVVFLAVFLSHLFDDTLFSLSYFYKCCFMKRLKGYLVGGGVSLVFFVVLWQIAAFFNADFLVPGVDKTASRGFSYIQTDVFWKDLRQTLWPTVLGVFIASLLGFVVAWILVKYWWSGTIIWPYLFALQSLPLVAVLPLLSLWLSSPTLIQLILVVLMSILPIIISVRQGFLQINKDYYALMKNLGASSWQTFRYLELPMVVGNFFSGLMVAVSLAYIGSVITELYLQTSGYGLGYRLVEAKLVYFDTALMFALIVFLIVVGLVLQGIIYLLQRYFLPVFVFRFFI